MANYEAANQRFTTGVFWELGAASKLADASAMGTYGWPVTLLEFIEGGNLYKTITLFPPLGVYGSNATYRYAPNQPAFATSIATYLCPSDGGELTLGGRSRSNYVGCFSPDGTGIVEREAYTCTPNRYHYDNPSYNMATAHSIFNWNVWHPVADVVDGLSNTVAFSEVIRGSGGVNIAGVGGTNGVFRIPIPIRPMISSTKIRYGVRRLVCRLPNPPAKTLHRRGAAKSTQPAVSTRVESTPRSWMARCVSSPIQWTWAPWQALGSIDGGNSANATTRSNELKAFNAN